MTREEIIQSFPREQIADVSAMKVIMYISIILVGLSAILLMRVYKKRFKNENRQVLFFSLLSGFLVLSFLLFSVSTAYVIKGENPFVRDTRSALINEWYNGKFKTYVEGLETKKVPIYDYTLTGEGNLTIMLETDDNKKIYSGITDFGYYESDDSRYKGYVLVKDLGNLEDFPADSQIQQKHRTIEISSVFLRVGSGSRSGE